MPTDNEPERAPTRVESAYLAGRKTVLGMPRWKFYLFLILAMAFGDLVDKELASRLSIPQSEASLLSLVAVVLFGILIGLIIRHSSRKEVH